MDSDEAAEKVPKSSIAHVVDSDDKSDERCKIMWIMQSVYSALRSLLVLYGNVHLLWYPS